MVVVEDAVFDTIGGGKLEQLSMQREKLKQVKTQQLEHFPLAGKAQQCCGGSVAVLLETFPVARLAVTIFGAGHIGRALVQVLEQCDSRVQWVDSRSERFPAGLAGKSKATPMDEPESMIALLAPEEKQVMYLTIIRLI